jgi:hypothetical protein
MVRVDVFIIRWCMSLSFKYRAKFPFNFNRKHHIYMLTQISLCIVLSDDVAYDTLIWIEPATSRHFTLRTGDRKMASRLNLYILTWEKTVIYCLPSKIKLLLCFVYSLNTNLIYFSIHDPQYLRFCPQFSLHYGRIALNSNISLEVLCCYGKDRSADADWIQMWISSLLLLLFVIWLRISVVFQRQSNCTILEKTESAFWYVLGL